jgi:hypothetical protein
LTQTYPAEIELSAISPLLSDRDLADILGTTVPWVRGHAHEIPGFERLGSYYRFRHSALEQWLGSLDHLFDAEQTAALLKVPASWVYANADRLPGVLRLGRYIRFRPAVIRQFLNEWGVAH